MKKFYSFLMAAFVAVSSFAQNGEPLYITGQGDFPGGTWSPENASAFTYSNGVYKIEVANLSSFKISTVMGDWSTFNSGSLTCKYGDVPGNKVNLTTGDANINTPWTGDYTITVGGDLSYIILDTNTPNPGMPTLYIRGDMNGWGVDEAWALTPVANNVFKFDFAAGQAIEAGKSFKIADKDWGKYNIGGNGNAIALDVDVPVYNGGNPANMTLNATCTGVLWLTLDYEGTAYFYATNVKEDIPYWAGVNDVETDHQASTRYYNLQGVEVTSPQTGLYIVCRGDKVTKEYILK